MQTFLPYPDFAKSAKVLDRMRLNKQRIECYQLLNGLYGIGKGWVNHPASKMWKGYEQALVAYGIAIVEEWKSRGYKDTCLEKIQKFAKETKRTAGVEMPPWMGNPDFHIAHQSNLVRKLPEHYRQFFPDVPDNLPYIWSVE